MATAENPTTLELTKIESTLRQLLLDVAAFIDGAPKSEPATENDGKEKTVLRFTGGWVRDKLLGVQSHDIDVAINNMTGLQFGQKMKDYLAEPSNSEKYDLPVPKETEKENGNGKGRRLGTGLYKIEANPEKSKHLETVTTNILGLDIDLVNLRKETYSEDSRNPQMEFGTPEEDALRRDATVNAMFYNLNTCQIEDFTGCGFDDMQKKIIRTPLEPYQTFKDDPLRVLRLIRFASRLQYTIDPAAEEAMSNAEIREALKIKISRERVGIETEKMLKGPDPHLALSLIDRLGLYETVFTDPTRTMEYSPDIGHLRKGYDFVREILSDARFGFPAIRDILIKTSDDQYFAWITAALMPWADAPLLPPPKPTGRPQYAAHLVAREGLKIPNKISDVVATASKNVEEIRKIKDDCYIQVKYPHRKNTSEEAAARDTLGMAIRRWGPLWKQEVLYSLIHEICSGSISRETTLDSYSTFLQHLTKLDILEAYNFKPLLTGTELAKALNTKPGPWMKDALDVVMCWQLLHPETTDPAAAVEMVKSSNLDIKAEEPKKKAKKNSELSARLAAHFLRLTIRPLFSAQKHPNLTATGRKADLPEDQKASLPDDTSTALWKDPKQAYAIDLLRWVLSVLDAKGVEENWGLLIPPILSMMDDIDTKWKATGCQLLTSLLKSTPASLLARTGLGKLFEETLMPLFTYLPTLTPEEESIQLLDNVFPAVLALASILYPPTPPTQSSPSFSQKQKQKPVDPFNRPERKHEKFLDAILRQGILATLFHAQPATYPALASTILLHLPELLQEMGIDSVKHLQSLIPLLSGILAEPLGPTYPRLLVTATKGLQSVILNGWPRIAGYKGEIMRGVSVCWIRVCEEMEGKNVIEGEERWKELESVKQELRIVVQMLDSVFCEEFDWRAEKESLVSANGSLKDLIG